MAVCTEFWHLQTKSFDEVLAVSQLGSLKNSVNVLCLNSESEQNSCLTDFVFCVVEPLSYLGSFLLVTREQVIPPNNFIMQQED